MMRTWHGECWPWRWCWRASRAATAGPARPALRSGRHPFGAVCPARDAGAALVLPVADGETMNLHLAEISRNVAPGSHAVVLLDGAGWHQTGGKLKVPDNISLLKLPAYSPELNPVENVWQYLRQNQLSNRVFDGYDAIVDACSMLGTHSPLNQAASNQLRPAHGHRLLSDAVGII